MPGVTVQLVNEKTRDTQTWQYKGGPARLPDADADGRPVIPLFEGEATPTGRQLCRAKAPPGPWPSPKKARRCARATST